MADLLPCPFCGNQPERLESKFWTGMRNDVIRVEYRCHCDGLPARQRGLVQISGVTDEEALEAWNRRVPAKTALDHFIDDVEAAEKPPFGTKRAAALALYKPPFRFTHGYIYDAEHQMVADQDGFEGAVETHIAARVRGWGRIGYLPDAAALQDEVGQAIADALTSYWTAAMKGDQP